MDVTTLSGPDAACDELVRNHPDGKVYHLPAWSEMVGRAMGYGCYYLVAREGGPAAPDASLVAREAGGVPHLGVVCQGVQVAGDAGQGARDAAHVVGILPLTHVRSRLFGNRMVSQAFGSYGGPISRSEQALGALFARACELATELGCRSIEFRNVQAMPFPLVPREGKVCMHLPLAPEPQDLWKGFDAKVRNQVRKAEKSGLTVVGGAMELLDDFYAVYTARLRQLGTPPYSRSILRAILETFPAESRIFVVRKDGRTVAAGFTLACGKFAEIPWAATLVEYNNLCPNHLLYWTVLEHFCRAGVNRFDFGRCTVEGPTYRFKKQWGAEPVELHYQYWVKPGESFSAPTPDNPSYGWKIAVWKRLPLWFTRAVGPRISWGIP